MIVPGQDRDHARYAEKEKDKAERDTHSRMKHPIPPWPNGRLRFLKQIGDGIDQGDEAMPGNFLLQNSARNRDLASAKDKLCAHRSRHDAR